MAETMDEILSDAKPAEKPAESPKEQLSIPEVPEAKVERPMSRKQAHRDLEQEAQGRVRNPETGQYAAKEAEPAKVEAKVEPKVEVAKPVVAPQQEFTEKEKAFQRAMMEERGKRQELERRFAALEATKQPASTEAAKTFWDDPDGALAKHRAEIRAEAMNARLHTAEFISRQKHTDFDAKVEVFGQIIQQTPGLREQWVAAPDMAEFAYNIAKNHMELQEAGGIPELRAKIAAETRLQIEAELKVKAEALAKERAALPPSLSEARSSGVNKPVWGGVPSMSSILHDK